MLVCDHKLGHNDFKFLRNESNRYLLELKESSFINRDKPQFNKNFYSHEPLLFWVFHIGQFILSNFATDITSIISTREISKCFILIISISEISKYFTIVFM